MVALPPVVCPPLLPSVELQAARLDGEVYGIGAGASPIDVVERDVHRALALMPLARERMIAERRTAAWVWGALDRPPHPWEFCVGAAERTSRPADSSVRIREVVLDRQDWWVVGGVRVMTPLRTMIELARVPDTWTTDDGELLRRLSTISAVTAEDCGRSLDAARKLPHKRRAWFRIAAELSRN